MDDPGTEGRYVVGDEGPAFETDYETRPSVAVVRAVAAVGGVPATDVSLHGCVDADALDRLFGRPGAAGREADLAVEFPVSGYSVTVRADGTVRVRATDE